MRQIALSRGMVALVDDEDYDLLSSFIWHANPTHSKTGRQLGFYACRGAAVAGVRTTVYMHRVIAGALRGDLVDHADKNGLNNQRSNLRICTAALNNANAAWKVGKSGFRGVYPCKKKWAARIQADGITYPLGRFEDRADAARAYDAAAVQKFGSFATLNFPA